jgi:hypothetical protein
MPKLHAAVVRLGDDEYDQLRLHAEYNARIPDQQAIWIVREWLRRHRFRPPPAVGPEPALSPEPATELVA